jgi:GT2 family glycosyltransferase
MRLFTYSWPKEGICREPELYYRITAHGPEGGSVSPEYLAPGGFSLRIRKGAVVSFDTYFNCFSYAKYREYTRVQKITAVLNLYGSALLRLMALRKQSDGSIAREILTEREVHTQELTAIRLDYDFSSDSSQGYYYTEIAGLEEVCCSGGFWETPVLEPPNPVKMAVVICTFKREYYLYRNMARVERDILGLEGPESIKDKVKFFIIDNGKTIPPDRWNGEHIRVFPNKNYGGSGGFTRGIIEAYRRRDEFTHVLLMDDDIVFDPETLVKTVRFLTVARPEHRDLCIGGSMLLQEVPFMQHEAGGLWDGMRYRSAKHGLDLRQWDAVLENERKESVDYQAWWYMCMPLAIVTQYGLPLPLFVNSDDVEYGIRTKEKVEILNGIGVWHPNFRFKDSMPLVYYRRRNSLVVTALHRPRRDLPGQWFCIVYSALSVVYAVLVHLVFQRYTAAEFSLRAVQDFLKGPDFFLNTDEEELHKQLSARAAKIYTDEELKKQGANSSLARKVLHYNAAGRGGFIKVWVLSFRLLFICIKMLCRYPGAVRSYWERINELTGFEFWCKHLDVPLGNLAA